MSALSDMCRTLDAIGTDIRQMASLLYATSGELEAASGQPLRLSKSVDHDRTTAFKAANAMAAAARATRSAASLLSEAESVASSYVRAVWQATSGSSGSSMEPGQNPSQQSTNQSRAEDALMALGLQPIECVLVDFSDNPILSVKGNDVQWSDYLWAAETFRDTILPAIVLGSKREDFQRLDIDEGRVGLRRLTGAYDLYCGSDPVKLALRANGTYDVIGGRHRVEAARQVGLSWVPARVAE